MIDDFKLVFLLLKNIPALYMNLNSQFQQTPPRHREQQNSKFHIKLKRKIGDLWL